MLIEPQSPLRRIPESLDRREALFFDGIRFTVEMMDIAYRRLADTLHEHAQAQNPAFRQSNPMALPFLDAWSIVDSVNRLRRLLDRLPTIKHKQIPEREVFLRGTETVDEFRNRIQHLDTEMTSITESKEPVWGTISWFTSLDSEIGGQVQLGRISLMVSGSIFREPQEFKFINPCGQTIIYPVGLITLSSCGLSLCLTEIHQAVLKVIRALEREFEKRFTDLPKAASDLYASVDLTPND